MAVLWSCVVALAVAITQGADPEVKMTASEIIRYNGYPVEDHWVTTKDGFILGMQRIPRGKNSDPKPGPRPVAFIQHGLLCSSTNWIVNFETDSLAFLLADAGFDVWLGNVRGNTYSRNHTHLSPNDTKFWAWSFDEMALYDLPAMLYYVMNQTGHSSIYYIGHSQGTVMAFAGFSVNQELASHIKAFFALAPVTNITYVKGLVKYLAPIEPELQSLVGNKDFLPSNAFTKLAAETLCDVDVVDTICSDVIFIICGFDTSNLNNSRLPVYISHTPAGTSVQNMAHFAQGVNKKAFQMFDYGSAAANRAHYNQDSPPPYNITSFTVPTYAYSGGNDWLADPTDVAALLPQLSQLKGHKVYPTYQHLDFIWAENASTEVYKDIIEKATEIEAGF
eukprot:m.308342 g.308342  ORF g.308342 m.308342 type:complete len:392 (+) comp43800_c0_seq1:40-1215(+)